MIDPRHPARSHRPLRDVAEGADGNGRRESEEMVGSDARIPAERNGYSPAAARRALGGELRELRQATGMTLSDVADRLQRSTATMSRLERGTSIPREIDVRALLELYEEKVPGLVTDERRASALDLARSSREGNWLDDFRDVIGTSTSQQHQYLAREADAQDFASFQSELIPGLLQTPGYARAMADIYRSEDSDEQKQRFVELRMERQKRMAGRPMHFVISEVALLRRSVHTDAAMPEQLQVLANELTDGRENVTIQVAPSSLLLPAATRGPFVLMRLGSGAGGVVFLEHQGVFVDGDADIAAYRKDFDELSAKSLDVDASLELVQEVAKKGRD